MANICGLLNNTMVFITFTCYSTVTVTVGGGTYFFLILYFFVAVDYYGRTALELKTSSKCQLTN